LVVEIHDRMPLIIAPDDYARWLSDEPDPRALMWAFPAQPMRMWPISTRVNKTENDEPSIVERSHKGSTPSDRRCTNHSG